MFFCKNNIWLIFSESKRVRFSVTTFFAAEKRRSTLVFDAGIEQTCLAILDKDG
jgi:hypothetical protein